MLQQTPRKPSKWLKFGLGVLLVAVLAVGLLGYMSPSMQLQWETIATMCGF